MRTLTHSDLIAMMKRVGEITLTTEASIMNWDDADRQLNWLHARVKVEEDGPCVYAWVEEAADGELVVLYIGKTSKTLEQRCSGHENGFRRKGKGTLHAEALWPKLRAGSRIYIYALWPAPIAFMGHMIDSQSSVEDWLLTAVKPRPLQNHQKKGKKTRISTETSTSAE